MKEDQKDFIECINRGKTTLSLTKYIIVVGVLYIYDKHLFDLFLKCLKFYSISWLLVVLGAFFHLGRKHILKKKAPN